jgi:hypothetical protein
MSPPTPAPPAEPAPTPRGGAASLDFLDRLRRLGLLDLDRLDDFLADRGDRLDEYDDDPALGRALVQAGLLTRYPLDRVLAGADHGLVLGAYHVLDELGGGGMGVVYRAEHALMKRSVALKALPLDEDCPASVRQRFYAEMRLPAELHHPHVVTAFDAGEAPGAARRCTTSARSACRTRSCSSRGR